MWQSLFKISKTINWHYESGVLPKRLARGICFFCKLFQIFLYINVCFSKTIFFYIQVSFSIFLQIGKSQKDFSGILLKQKTESKSTAIQTDGDLLNDQQ